MHRSHRRVLLLPISMLRCHPLQRRAKVISHVCGHERSPCSARSIVPRAKILAVILFIAAGSCASAQAPGALNKGDLITGPATVVDGNSLDIKSNRIVLWGIDTPERGAWCYSNGRRWKPRDESWSALRRCVEGKTVTCRVQKIERAWFRRRHTSECWTDDGMDVGECMIRAGWATRLHLLLGRLLSRPGDGGEKQGARASGNVTTARPRGAGGARDPTRRAKRRSIGRAVPGRSDRGIGVPYTVQRDLARADA